MCLNRLDMRNLRLDKPIGKRIFDYLFRIGACEGNGEVAERLKAPLSKSGILPKAGSWVRIPPSPPLPVTMTIGNMHARLLA